MYHIRLANVAGLDINNAQHSVCIDEVLIGIEDKEAFLEFCRDKKDGIEYSTKTERLDTLSTRYKKLQGASKLPLDTAKTFSEKLNEKVSSVRVSLKNSLEGGNSRPFSTIFVNGERYFTEKELKALASLGSSSVIIELSEQGKLKESLINIFIEKYKIKSKYAALSDGQKRIKNLLGGIK